MIPCEFLNVNMSVRRKDNLYSHCRPLSTTTSPTAPSTAGSTDSRGSRLGSGASSGTLRTRTLRTPSPATAGWSSSESRHHWDSISNKVHLAATFWAEEEEEPGSGILRTLSLTLPQPLRCPRPLLCSRVWPLMGAHSASARPRVTEPTSRGHLRSYSTFQKSAPTNQHFYTSDKSTLWYQLALLLDHLIYTY